MNRRGFLKLIPAAAVTAAVLPQACAALAEPLAKPKATIGLHPFWNNGASSGVCQLCGEAITDPRHQIRKPRMISGYEIAESGELSLDGQTLFQIYGQDGGLALGHASYTVLGDKVFEFRYTHKSRGIPKYDGDGDLGRGSGMNYERKAIAQIRRDAGGYEYFDPF